MKVVKRNGSLVNFDKSKIENAILKAMKYGSGIVRPVIASNIADEIEEYFKDIHEYLKSQSNVDEKLLSKADSIERFISEIERKYESILKEK